VSGVYSDLGLPDVSDGLDVSFESVHSEGLAVYRDDRSQTSGSSSGYGGSDYRHRHSTFLPQRRQSQALVSTPSSAGSPHDSSPTKGSRASMSSLDSGWASNPVAFSSFASQEESQSHSHGVVTAQHRRLSTISSSSSVVAPPRTSSISAASFRGSSESIASSRCSQSDLFRQRSRYSSNSSLGSSRASEDRICTMDIRQMIEQGLPELEIVNCWLTDLRFEEYFGLFASAGYDISTISRMTPEDLTAIGIKKPHHRKKLKSEIEKLKLTDWLPRQVPQSVEEMMHLLRLSQYTGPLLSQGYHEVKDVLAISIEDLEDIGFYMLGHQKRLLLGIKRIRELRTGKLQSIAEYHPEEVAMSSLPPTLHSKQSFSSFHGLTGSKTNQSNNVWFPAQPDHSAPSEPGPAHHPQDMPTPMEPFNHNFYQTFRPGSGVPSGGPSSAPQVFNIHGVTQQNVEIPPSSASIWQKFPSFQDGGVREVGEVREPDIWVARSGHGTRQESQGGGGGGTLPRPTATVKPLLSLVGGEAELAQVSDDACSDYNMPFANERLGTIRLKTTPGQEREGDCCDVSSPGSGKNLLRTPTRATGRTATDVMEDISCMLADLTDELDSMLCSESVAHTP